MSTAAGNPNITRSEIVALARDWLGVPYLHQGRSRQGTDCVGITVSIARTCGMRVDDWTRYGRVPHGPRLLAAFRAHMCEVELNSYRTADVALLSWRREPHHVAIITEIAWGRLGLLHCNQEIGRVVEHRIDMKWRKRIRYVFRFPFLREGN